MHSKVLKNSMICTIVLHQKAFEIKNQLEKLTSAQQ